MEIRQLGNSSLNLPVLTLGTWELGDPSCWTPGNQPEDVVRAALDHGINSFDCAESYQDGETEIALGRALGKDRSRAIIGTKVSAGNLPPERVVASCEASLRRLGTDTIDLYQVHWPNPEVPFEDTCGALERLRQQGKIREIGVSNFGPRDMRAWLRAGRLASNQMCYNALFRAIEFELLPDCISNQIGLIAYSPLMGVLGGRWLNVDEIPRERRNRRIFGTDSTDPERITTAAEVTRVLQGFAALSVECGLSRPELAIGWRLAQPGVTTTIFGGKQPGQIERNARAAAVKLDSGILARINQLTDPLKQRVGPNADPWLEADESRVR